MPLILQNLRGKILGCTTNSKGSVFDSFGEPEISEFEVSVSANEHVFRLQIAINDVLTVKVFEN